MIRNTKKQRFWAVVDEEGKIVEIYSKKTFAVELANFIWCKVIEVKVTKIKK